MIKKLVAESIYILSEEEIRNREAVSVYYTDNTYRNDVKHITELTQAIVKDYPRMKYSDMHVHKLSSKAAYMHAFQTVIEILIPAEDFMRLKKSDEIEIM